MRSAEKVQELLSSNTLSAQEHALSLAFSSKGHTLSLSFFFSSKSHLWCWHTRGTAYIIVSACTKNQCHNTTNKLNNTTEHYMGHFNIIFPGLVQVIFWNDQQVLALTSTRAYKIREDLSFKAPRAVFFNLRARPEVGQTLKWQARNISFAGRNGQ